MSNLQTLLVTSLSVLLVHVLLSQVPLGTVGVGILKFEGFVMQFKGQRRASVVENVISSYLRLHRDSLPFDGGDLENAFPADWHPYHLFFERVTLPCNTAWAAPTTGEIHKP